MPDELLLGHLSNNDRPAFQNLHSIDKLSIAINLIACADYFSREQSHYLIFGKQSQRSIAYCVLEFSACLVPQYVRTKYSLHLP